MTDFTRHGPDRLQKYFLYLIVIDWVLLALGWYFLERLSFSYGIVVCVMLLLYNALLVKLCFFRARRASDGYLLYPVTFACVMAGVLFGFQVFFR
ncbi:hypothetical protein [Ferrimonas marina]|uniref:Uncharacterized protein n=1 Tax=Ferrimonas marina TaxID=299255 RepID=A0A1M5QT11_9GAMM|nr:hypothetical protein [Ferrimonas marina]SHH17295.1 hypothetical protein SAMN02745129_1350 [Ferrimonas marina]